MTEQERQTSEAINSKAMQTVLDTLIEEEGDGKAQVAVVLTGGVHMGKLHRGRFPGTYRLRAVQMQQTQRGPVPVGEMDVFFTAQVVVFAMQPVESRITQATIVPPDNFR